MRFADIVFRLPAELLQRKDSNVKEAFALTLAVGTAIKLDIDRQYLNEAFKKFDRISGMMKAAKIANPGMIAEREQALLAWRTAFFRAQHDKHPYPEKISKKEISFLEDLLALQSK